MPKVILIKDLFIFDMNGDEQGLHKGEEFKLDGIVTDLEVGESYVFVRNEKNKRFLLSVRDVRESPRGMRYGKYYIRKEDFRA